MCAMVPVTPDPLSSLLYLSNQLLELDGRRQGMADVWIALARSFSRSVSEVSS